MTNVSNCTVISKSPLSMSREGAIGFKSNRKTVEDKIKKFATTILLRRKYNVNYWENLSSSPPETSM